MSNHCWDGKRPTKWRIGLKDVILLDLSSRLLWQKCYFLSECIGEQHIRISHLVKNLHTVGHSYAEVGKSRLEINLVQIIWTKPSRFFSGPDRNLDFVWTKSNFFLQIRPDWIQIKIWKVSGPDENQMCVKLWPHGILLSLDSNVEPPYPSRRPSLTSILSLQVLSEKYNFVYLDHEFRRW